MKFSKMISVLESELNPDLHIDAFCWVDKKYNNAHNLEEDRLRLALDSMDDEVKEKQVELYAKRVVGWFKEFKTEKQIDDSKDFLDSLEHLL